MKSYIIRLSKYKNSVEWSQSAYESGLKYNWDINFFEGIDGTLTNLEAYNLTVNKNYKKAKASFERPGTVGCFLSHYSLWKKSLELNEAICILEHDITIHSSFPTLDFKDVIKLSNGPKAKNTPYGEWWTGAMAYCITPSGAKKLIDFSHNHGAMPADAMLSNGIVDLQFFEPINTIVTYVIDDFSFTWDLK